LSTNLKSRMPSLSTYQRSASFEFAPIRGRSGASSWIAIRRTIIRLLARLAIAATCTGSAAAFDAEHISRMTLRRHEARPNCIQSSLAAIEAPVFTTGHGFAARSRPASQREVEVQPGEAEEIGKQ
jgi:hypothetical protein